MQSALTRGALLSVPKGAIRMSTFPWAESAVTKTPNNGPGSLKQQTKNVALFTPLKIRQLTLKNRVAVSPMCQYSSEDGFMTDWHLVHLGSYAKGGAGLIMFEASAVTDIGRISPYDAGIWKDEHIAPMKRIVDFIHAHKAAAGLQIAHAGRKASTAPPFFINARGAVPPSEGGWDVVGPSAVPFSKTYPFPTELTLAQIKSVVHDFVEATKRADRAGFDVLEVHGAHGYLLNEFLSPVSNKRTDEYGGSFEGRIRFVLEVVSAVRAAWPAGKPLSVRLSCTDWVEGGWDIEQTVRLSAKLNELGVDIIDCSSGGNDEAQKIQVGPLYQVGFSEEVRAKVNILTAAVGLITTPQEAEGIVKEGKADIVMMAREFLREPFWPIKAAIALGVHEDLVVPPQYSRAFPTHKL